MTNAVQLALLFAFTILPATVAGTESALLHEQIDARIAAAQGELSSSASPRSSDTEFLRRVYLDVTGRIPGRHEVTAFQDEEAGDKRLKLVDRLLLDPWHARHMLYHLDVMLMGRLPEKHIKVAQWRDYLYTSLLENKRFNQLVAEILLADGAVPDERPRARFLLARELNIDDTTRDIGRIFLGRDLQCAQCHDHPSIDDYLQRRYYGLSAFLGRSYLFQDPETKETSIGEKAEGEVTFTSVFTDEESTTAPRLLELAALDDPPAEEEPYVTKPEEKTRGVPKYSRRLQLAPNITSEENVAFRMNIANRLWALVMGRGLVEPLDMMHTDNPPSHPELLALLADELLRTGYDMRSLMRQLILSETYQRSSRLVANDPPLPESAYLAAALKPLTPEQLAWSTMQAVGLVETTRSEHIARFKEEDPSFDPNDMAQAIQLERAVHDSLQPHVDTFVAVFASKADRFSATASQALFLENGELITEWLTPSNGNLLERLLQTGDAEAATRELYLTVLSRPPTDEELEQLVAFLGAYDDDQMTGMTEATRAILCSAEFRFNH